VHRAGCASSRGPLSNIYTQQPSPSATLAALQCSPFLMTKRLQGHAVGFRIRCYNVKCQ